ncbi:hypothetical protein RJ55_00865 [Drechmeria coniospora]|nr:hypothetical protein RJ55_00865 [Drechmeria coniospora]
MPAGTKVEAAQRWWLPIGRDADRGGIWYAGQAAPASRSGPPTGAPPMPTKRDADQASSGQRGSIGAGPLPLTCAR